MIVFELSMPGRGSWNGRWSGEDKCFAKVYEQRRVPKEYWNKSFDYFWDDGWCACVTATKMPAKEARKIAMKSQGFCGYDWMIESIIRYGKIIRRKEWTND